MVAKKLAVLAVAGALAAMLALVGCGSQQAASSAASAAASQASAAASQASAAASQAASQAATAQSAAASAQAQAASAAAQAAPAQNTNNYIGEQAAIDAALAHAGIAANDCVGLEAELDLDDAVVHYDVDFKSGGLEYDYDIDATTGEVIYSHSEYDD